MDVQEKADALFEEALTASGARDPRDYYRERLKDLKGANPEAYATAVTHYKEVLLPSIVEGSDPLLAWRAYGLKIAQMTAEGRTVDIDPTGVAQPYEEPGTPEGMVLHLPTSTKIRALLVALPVDPSPAQLATHAWLVAGRKVLRDT